MPILNRCIVCSATVFLPMLTFSEEVLLLLLDEREGIFLSVGKNTLELAMAGAVLMELAFAGRIDTDLERLVVIDRAPTGNPMLDDVLELMAKREEINNTREWIETLAIEKTASIQEQALASLVERGTLRREEKRLFQETIEHLWIFRSPRYFLTEGELTEGELTEGELTEGELTEGERTDAERTDAERTDAERTDAERTDAERTDGKRTRAVPTDREPTEAEPGHNAKTRFADVLFTDEIPDPKDIALICLVDACGILSAHLADDVARLAPRIEQLRRMDLIGREIASAIMAIDRSVIQSTAHPLAR